MNYNVKKYDCGEFLPLGIKKKINNTQNDLV